MSKRVKKKMAKASLPNKADKASKDARDLLGRSIRNEQRILKLSRQLRRAVANRDTELKRLVSFISDWEGFPDPTKASNDSATVQ